MTQTPKTKAPYNPLQNPTTFVEDIDAGSFSATVDPVMGLAAEIDDEAGPITISVETREEADGVHSAPNPTEEKVVQKNIAPTKASTANAGYTAEYGLVSEQTRAELEAGREALARYRVPTVE